MSQQCNACGFADCAGHALPVGCLYCGARPDACPGEHTFGACALEREDAEMVASWGEETAATPDDDDAYAMIFAGLGDDEREPEAAS